MKKKISKEVKAYLFFGVLTTIINYLVFAFGIYFWQEEKALQVNFVAFIIATLFAFVTNKKYVFEKKTTNWKKVGIEFFQFVVARIFSMGIEQAGLFVCIKGFHVVEYTIYNINGLMISKVILSFVSVLLNYIASKWIIFSEKGE